MFLKKWSDFFSKSPIFIWKVYSTSWKSNISVTILIASWNPRSQKSKDWPTTAATLWDTSKGTDFSVHLVYMSLRFPWEAHATVNEYGRFNETSLHRLRSLYKWFTHSVTCVSNCTVYDSHIELNYVIQSLQHVCETFACFSYVINFRLTTVRNQRFGQMKRNSDSLYPTVK